MESEMLAFVTFVLTSSRSVSVSAGALSAYQDQSHLNLIVPSTSLTLTSFVDPSLCCSTLSALG